MRGNHRDRQPIDFHKLLLLRFRGAGHSRQRLIQAEEVLEGDGGQRLVFILDGHSLLGFNGLMQPIGISPPEHQASGKFINEYHFAVLHHVIDIALITGVGAHRRRQALQNGQVFGIRDIANAQRTFEAGHAVFRQTGGFVLAVRAVVHLGAQLANRPVDVADHLGRFIAGAGNNQRGARLIDQDGVHLVDDGEGQLALRQVTGIDGHVVAQIIEAQFGVCCIEDIGLIRRMTRDRSQRRGGRRIIQERRQGAIAAPGLRDAGGQAEKGEDRPHLRALIPHKVIVDRHQVRAMPGQRMQIERGRGDQGFAFAGFHLGNHPLVQDDAADQLLVERFHEFLNRIGTGQVLETGLKRLALVCADNHFFTQRGVRDLGRAEEHPVLPPSQDAPGSLAHHGIRFRENLIKRCPLGQSGFEGLGHRLELRIGHRLHAWS
ncbi:MAG: hypothetical protein BWY76_01761 [bacterium ADurb.Bin429]|nr:MAG: hypothetical protein BWY76_01761 [bacterium ADurb.Bin429]